MGEIVQLNRFRNERVAAATVSANADAVEAEIVIFPGVRVERQTVDLSVRQQQVASAVAVGGAKKSGRKRTRACPEEKK